MSDHTAAPTIHMRPNTSHSITVTCDRKLRIRNGNCLKFYGGRELSGEYWERLGEAAQVIVRACMSDDVRLVTVTVNGTEIHFNDSANFAEAVEEIRRSLWDVRHATDHVAVDIVNEVGHMTTYANDGTVMGSVWRGRSRYLAIMRDHIRTSGPGGGLTFDPFALAAERRVRDLVFIMTPPPGWYTSPEITGKRTPVSRMTITEAGGVGPQLIDPDLDVDEAAIRARFLEWARLVDEKLGDLAEVVVIDTDPDGPPRPEPMDDC